MLLLRASGWSTWGRGWHSLSVVSQNSHQNLFLLPWWDNSENAPPTAQHCKILLFQRQTFCHQEPVESALQNQGSCQNQIIKDTHSSTVNSSLLFVAYGLQVIKITDLDEQ